MPAVEASHLSYSYGRTEALHDVNLVVPDGALYALLGPNGAGKTTLLQILAGLRRATSGRVAIIGKDRATLTRADKARISYVAEGQRLPGWMRLEQLEAYLAPLYPAWDHTLADSLRDRFALDSRRRVGTFSRGEHMKAALLCAVAPRPQLVLMDEPFTGMDPVVKDDLVRGLLASAASDGWTAIISSHDVGELELLTDWVGFIDHGRMRISEDRDRLRERFKRVTIISADAASLERRDGDDWLSADRAGQRLTFITDSGAPDRDATLRARFPAAEAIEVHDATLGEIFVAMVRQGAGAVRRGAAA